MEFGHVSPCMVNCMMADAAETTAAFLYKEGPPATGGPGGPGGPPGKATEGPGCPEGHDAECEACAVECQDKGDDEPMCNIRCMVRDVGPPPCPEGHDAECTACAGECDGAEDDVGCMMDCMVGKIGPPPCPEGMDAQCDACSEECKDMGFGHVSPCMVNCMHRPPAATEDGPPPATGDF